MKKLNAILKACLVMIFVLVASQSVLANDGGSVGVSREEVARSISVSQGITYEDALAQLLESERVVLEEKGVDPKARSSAISYRYYTATKKVAFMEIEAWAYVQMWSSGSFREFLQVVDTGTSLSGFSTAIFQGSVNATITTPIRLDLSCKGYLTTTAAVTLTPEASLELIGAGVSISGSAGTNVNFYTSVEISRRWDLY